MVRDFKKSLVLRCQHGGNENDAIHIILAEGSEIGQLLIGIIFRIGKLKS